jgi:hypothetical protein
VCQMLFVNHSAAKRYDKAPDAVKNSIALTIGEDADFLQHGGMVNLQASGTGGLFDVSLYAVNEGHRKLSSQLLSLARHVVHHVEIADADSLDQRNRVAAGQRRKPFFWYGRPQDSYAEQLVKEADVALYRAKECCRNRSVLAKPSGLQEVPVSGNFGASCIRALRAERGYV